MPGSFLSRARSSKTQLWNGKRVLDHHDGTFTEVGRVGVWTKADSITYFDDLKTEAL
jgi:hypothetical protein